MERGAFLGGCRSHPGTSEVWPRGPEGQGSCWERRVLGIWEPDWSGPWSEGAVRDETVGAANSSGFCFFVILLFYLHK